RNGSGQGAPSTDAGPAEASPADGTVATRDGAKAPDGATPPDGAGSPDGATHPVGASVLQFHNHATRDGAYVDPRLTRANASTMHVDPAFATGLIDGSVYAQPLYVENGPVGSVFLVATEKNDVYALDETGAQKWTRNVGAPAARAQGCGNIQPLGI